MSNNELFEHDVELYDENAYLMWEWVDKRCNVWHKVIDALPKNGNDFIAEVISKPKHFDVRRVASTTRVHS
jgi:hypothetical protein